MVSEGDKERKKQGRRALKCFIGEECAKCGSTLRYKISKQCATCMRSRKAAQGNRRQRSMIPSSANLKPHQIEQIMDSNMVDYRG